RGPATTSGQPLPKFFSGEPQSYSPSSDLFDPPHVLTAAPSPTNHHCRHHHGGNRCHPAGASPFADHISAMHRHPIITTTPTPAAAASSPPAPPLHHHTTETTPPPQPSSRQLHLLATTNTSRHRNHHSNTGGFPAAAAAVAGCGWQISHHRHGEAYTNPELSPIFPCMVVTSTFLQNI
nr:hypothetical protein [Tanacetum cinerariifolium]